MAAPPRPPENAPQPVSRAPVLGRRSRDLVIALSIVMAAAVVVVVLTAPLAQTGVQPTPGTSTIVVGRSPLLDRAAPGFELRTLDGEAVRLADLRGRPALVNFWASWCIPCREEFGLLAAARRRHAERGLEILGVIYKDSPEAAAEFYRTHGGTWPALVDPGGTVAAEYGVLGLPITFYVDRRGIVRTVSYGPPPEDVFEAQLALIL